MTGFIRYLLRPELLLILRRSNGLLVAILAPKGIATKRHKNLSAAKPQPNLAADCTDHADGPNLFAANYANFAKHSDHPRNPCNPRLKKLAQKQGVTA